MLSDTAALAAFCDRQRGAEFITVDTEFIRDKTYWPRLCVAQVGGQDEAVAIDALAEGLDLAPLLELLYEPTILKVFHAARQDIEIFVNLTGKVPAPLFDTQIAAMVCGFGEQVGYDVLVHKLVGARIDKSSRFTDWARRPLSEKQLRYALDDVVHLRTAYEALLKRLRRDDRLHWLEEDMAALTDPAVYRVEPEDAWRRLKSRSTNARYLGVLKEVAAWREREAQRRDIPRSRILRDEAMFEVAAEAPRDAEQLAGLRGVGRGFAEGKLGPDLLAVVARGVALPDSELPHVERPEPPPQGIGPLVDLLKVLLKMKCDAHGVAQRVVASSDELERIAAEDMADVPALHGWRRELFGNDALALKAGRLALAARGSKIVLLAPTAPITAPVTDAAPS
jgi:ribonuclease D